MPIPQPIDYKMAELDALAASVTTALRTLRYSTGRDVKPVRERLQTYVNAVMEVAHDLAAVE